jgi:putative serine protease PepD
MADDEEPDDAFGFQPPLPPEDRLWRHPSELGPAGAANPITIVHRSPASPRLWLVAGLALLIGAGGTLAALSMSGALDDEAPITAIEQVQISVPKDPDASDLAIAEQVLPAIVRIDASGAGGERTGTGVIIRSDGVLLTSADAVDGANTITVTFHDDQAVAGSVIGIDHRDDVAVLKVELVDLPAATIGRADQLQLGERTVVISTDGKQPSASAVGVGLVSGLGEKVEVPSKGALHGMIRANVRVSSDATGAPLIDSAGAVVGIVTRRGANLADAGAAAERLDVRFATPIEWAKRIADEMVTFGRVSTAWLGVEGSDLTADEVDRAGRPGARVVRVNDGSPAAEAGLQPGDIVTEIDDEPIVTMSSLIVVLRYHEPNDVVRISYLRGGEPQVSLVTLVEKSSSP